MNLSRITLHKMNRMTVVLSNPITRNSSHSIRRKLSTTDRNSNARDEERFGTVNGGIRFGRILLTVRGVEGVANAVHFYQHGLGFEILRHTDEWAELSCQMKKTSNETDTNMQSPSLRLNVKGVYNEAEINVGYSPFLCFDVDDMDTTVTRCIQMGAHLDGPIQYPAHGKVATLRAPDGHMIGLYEASFS